jgi:DNA-binding MarR family transcriptional regulator
MATKGRFEADHLDVVASLAQLSFIVQGTLARVAEAHQLTVAHARLLMVLSDREPTMLTLAGIMGLGKSSLSGLVERAESRGLLERFGTQENRRAVRVRLTDEGRRRCLEYASAATPELFKLVQALPAPDRKRMKTLADQVIDDYVTRNEIDASTLDLPSRFV